MKIIYKVGDLIKAEEDVIAHGCNAQGVMGSGVAKSIRSNFPEAYEAYRKKYINDILHLGDIIPVLSKGKLIVNCITQEFYGKDGSKYVSYEAVRDCMKAINNLGYESFALPMIGAGLGGGDWAEISKIIEEECKDIQPVVYQMQSEPYDAMRIKYSRIGGLDDI